MIILAATGKSPFIQFYVTSYSVDGNMGNQTGFVFFVLCILGNIINVVMEEGIFRGLVLKLTEKKYNFLIAVIISSVLFGLWHLIAPIRSYIDGERSLSSMFMMMLMLFFATGITGAKFCLLAKMTGSLWLPMADHFINNTIVNILHIGSASGVDELQTIRVAIAPATSFIIVLINNNRKLYIALLVLPNKNTLVLTSYFDKFTQWYIVLFSQGINHYFSPIVALSLHSNVETSKEGFL